MTTTITDGDHELVLSTVVTHRFVRTGNKVHHFLLAGDVDAVPVLLIGGRPETWWTWHGRIEALAARHYVVAPEILLDDSLHARQIASVLDDLGVVALHVVADEHGQRLAEDLARLDRMRARIISSLSIGSGALAGLEHPDLTNRAIIEWLARREVTGGAQDEDRRVGTHLPEGP